MPTIENDAESPLLLMIHTLVVTECVRERGRGKEHVCALLSQTEQSIRKIHSQVATTTVCVDSVHCSARTELSPWITFHFRKKNNNNLKFTRCTLRNKTDMFCTTPWTFALRDYKRYAQPHLARYIVQLESQREIFCSCALRVKHDDQKDEWFKW